LPRLALDQVPAQTVAHAVQAVAVQLGVVVGRPAVVPRRGNQIETAAVAAPVVRTLETTKEETLEQTGVVHRLPHG